MELLVADSAFTLFDVGNAAIGIDAGTAARFPDGVIRFVVVVERFPVGVHELLGRFDELFERRNFFHVTMLAIDLEGYIEVFPSGRTVREEVEQTFIVLEVLELFVGHQGHAMG